MKIPFNRQTSWYSYILVRGDLPPAAQAVQGCHAAMSATHQFGLRPEQRLVLLRVPDQDALESIAGRCEQQAIDFSMFHEPDHDWGPTALATAPIQGGLKWLRQWPLWDVEAHRQPC